MFAHAEYDGVEQGVAQGTQVRQRETYYYLVNEKYEEEYAPGLKGVPVG